MKYTIFTRKNIYPFFLNVLDKGYILKEIARKLLKIKMPIDEIVEITELSEKEIKDLIHEETKGDKNE